jgi:hypothetical protein
MSEALHNLIQIAVRSTGGKPYAEQLSILKDCYDCADTPQLQRELQRLTELIYSLHSELHYFDADPPEDQI